VTRRLWPFLFAVGAFAGWAVARFAALAPLRAMLRGAGRVPAPPPREAGLHPFDWEMP